MTKDEFKILAKGLKAVYTMPSFLPDADSLNVWYSLLQDLPYEVCNVAIQKYMMTETKIPTIADIRNLCASVVVGEKPLWSDGWDEVMRAMRRYGSYNELEALESMSDITKQCVRRLGYQNLCRSEEIGVDRANFRMIFEQIANREHEKQKLPSGMQQLIASIQEKKMLESKNE
jgi:hypothetical protein